MPIEDLIVIVPEIGTTINWGTPTRDCPYCCYIKRLKNCIKSDRHEKKKNKMFSVYLTLFQEISG
jgi:hypothetical protein